MIKVLTIAGSDCSGGAGIQADIKTIAAHGMYAMSIITALTAQNTVGISEIFDIAPEFISRQIDAVFTDIFPDALKIGMASNAEIIDVIDERLRYYHARNIVIDPVMVSTSGSRLLSEKAEALLCEKLFPIADLVTPNIPEAEVICGFCISNKEDMIRAGKWIFYQFSCNVLIKGGHAALDATDLLYGKDGPCWILGERINNPNTHGTGCTLSSAIACGLAGDKSMYESVLAAKGYLSGALNAKMDLGQGAGPLDHMWRMR
ncbi:MAG: bifunctional hydroxymethylpyrimidine kinase/phosphomethylpyrimidine kinase [Lachnospiraceae bacterium]